MCTLFCSSSICYRCCCSAFLFLSCLETCCHCCNVQPWGLASGRHARSLFGSGHVNDYVILFVVRLFLAEGWHCKPFLSWIACQSLLLVLVYIHERSEHFHPLTILVPIPVRGWIFFPSFHVFFPSSHKDLAPMSVRGWKIFPSSHDLFPSSHDDLAPISVRGWKLFSILSQFFFILSQRFGANFSERMEIFLMFHVCRLVSAEQAIEKAMQPSSRLWL